MGGDNHLLGGVGVAMEMHRSLRPAGMPRMHLEPASIERDASILIPLLNKERDRRQPIFSGTLVRSWKNYVRAHMSTLTSNRRAL